MVKLFVDGKEVKFELTKFPDGTSQVWKLEDNLYEYDQFSGDPEILWMFESEAEIMHVVQLAHLVDKLTKCESVTLKVPYLPYGRQDKDISNTTSFALHSFSSILYHTNICRVETFDAHSNVQTNTYIDSEPATAFHKAIFAHDVVCFPDKGALARYSNSFKNVPMIYCEKVRNQLTGEITGLQVVNPENIDLDGVDILIVDDICDGGMTFIKVAEALKPFTPHAIDLAVSHGLFSKGKDVLYDAGINMIYTTNSLLRNPEGFKVC